MDSVQLIVCLTLGTGAALGVALVSGIRNRHTTGGKIAAIVSGLLLLALVAVVAFAVLMAIILPAVISLP